ncbi:twitching motility protein PilT [Halobacteriales archaeon QS_4_69_34]|nr:MAG: twitching motility protein PilT [Halobacteriales archaeon QS_4_69_34]
MICLDTGVLIDYLRGEKYVEEFLDEVGEPTGVSRLALYELYVGAVRSTDPAETPEAVDAALAWSETLESTAAAAREAATIRAALLGAGARMGLATR